MLNYYDKKLIEWKKEKITNICCLGARGRKVGATCGTWTCHPSRASTARDERPQNWICGALRANRAPLRLLSRECKNSLGNFAPGPLYNASFYWWTLLNFVFAHGHSSSMHISYKTF